MMIGRRACAAPAVTGRDHGTAARPHHAGLAEARGLTINRIAPIPCGAWRRPVL